MKSKLRRLYDEAKGSKLFVNLVPEVSHINMVRVYGTMQHNLPHAFYLGVMGENLVLAHESSRAEPMWFMYDYANRSMPMRCPELSSVIHRNTVSDSNWPYLFGEEPFGPKLLTTEQILNSGPEALQEFVIFNINLF